MVTLRICLGLAFALAPSICCANGWISGVNAFRQTPEFYFIFVAIVVVESIALWLWLRPIGWFAVLWRVVLLNAVSSFAGDVLFRLHWAPSSGNLWKQAIPFFLLTVVVECPLMRVLLRRVVHTWNRTVIITITVNVLSYALLMAIDRPVREAWLKGLQSKDRRILEQWTNTTILAHATGRIYATESSSGGPPHRLKYFDFVDRRWHFLTNSPAIDPRYWHIEGDLLAFLTYGEEASRGIVKLTTLPDCVAVRDFRLPPNSYRYGALWDVAISPDRRKFAALAPLHEIEGPLSKSDYQVVAISYLLVVFDIASGEASICPRKASHTLCWLPDSRAILFHSLPDQKLYELTTLPKDWKKNYDLSNPKSPFVNPPLFVYQLDTRKVEEFADISSPKVAPNAHRLAFRIGTDTLGVWDLDRNIRSTVMLGRIAAYNDFQISPDASLALAPLVLSPYISYWGYPTIIDLNNSSNRYYLGPITYRVLWARTTTQD